MFGRQADLAEIATVEAFVADARAHGRAREVECLICPPFTLLAAAAGIAQSIHIGAQDCHAAPDGAYTGEINAPMLKDAGARFVIVGHSERRQGRGEQDGDVRAKAEAAIAAGLTPIICVGETLAERQAGQAAEVVRRQVEASVPTQGALVLAYEPIWAIGTGLTPTASEIAAIHAVAREALPSAGTAILYGGSVKPGNAKEIFAIPGVDGALVGGASLRAVDFQAILAAHPAFA